MPEPLHSDEFNTAEVGDVLDVARSTVYRALARSKAGAVVAQATSPDARTHGRAGRGRGAGTKPVTTVSPAPAADATYRPDICTAGRRGGGKGASYETLKRCQRLADHRAAR